MVNEGRTGVQALADGTQAAQRLGKDGAICATDAHARYYETAYRGNVYTLNSGEIELASAFATGSAAGTAKLLCGIFNPTGSGKNAVILNAVIATTVAKKTGAPFFYNFLQVAAITSTTTGTILSTNLTSQTTSNSVLKAQNNVVVAAAAGTPSFTNLGIVGGMGKLETEALNTATGNNIFDAVEGKIVVPPGVAFGITCKAAGEEHKVNAQLYWEEAPV
jgi:hypothetical protein